MIDQRSSLARLVDDHPVAVFAPLALLVSWGVWITVFSLTPAWSPAWLLGTGVGAWGPGIAGAAVVKLRGESVRSWLGTGFGVDGRLRWTALALAGPALLALGVAAIVFAFVGMPASSNLVAVAPQLLASFVMTTLWTGGNEEFGWRGFALPHLQERYSALVSGLLIGGLWTVWHTPLFVYGLYTMPPAVYAVGTVSLSVILTWYHNTTGGWVPGAVLFHGSVNTFLNVPQLAVGGEGALGSLPIPYFGVIALVALVFAGVLVRRFGADTLTGRDRVVATWSTATDRPLQQGDDSPAGESPVTEG